jgi:hypothetical protein
MMGWIKNFFGATDRVTVAGERAAKAAEEIADIFEQARDQLRARLAIEPAAPTVVVKPIEAPAEQTDEKPTEAAKGKRAERVKG